MHQFESDAQVERYGKMHVSAIRKIGGRSATRIAEQVEDCLAGGSQCGCSACPKCTRAFRKWLLGKQVEQWTQSDERADLVTILSRKIPGGELSWDVVTSDMRRIRQILRRNELHLVGIGGVEIAWKPEYRAWVLHFHAILYGAGAEEIARLKETTFNSSLNKEVQVKTVDPHTFTKAASYCLKFGLTYTLRSETIRFLRSTFPLKGAELEEMTKLFAVRKPGDFLFLLGLRRRGETLEQTAKIVPHQARTDRSVGLPDGSKSK